MPDADHLLLDPEEQRLLLRLRGPSWRGRIGEVIAILDLFERAGWGREEVAEAIRVQARTPRELGDGEPQPQPARRSTRGAGRRLTAPTGPRLGSAEPEHRNLRGCRFDGDETIYGHTAKEVYVKAWRWLIRNQYVPAERLPIQYIGRKRYVAACEPVHPNGKRFVSPVQVGPGIWVETNQSQERLGRELMLAFEEFGVAAKLVWRRG